MAQSNKVGVFDVKRCWAVNTKKIFSIIEEISTMPKLWEKEFPEAREILRKLKESGHYSNKHGDRDAMHSIDIYVGLLKNLRSNFAKHQFAIGAESADN